MLCSRSHKCALTIINSKFRLIYYFYAFIKCSWSSKYLPLFCSHSRIEYECQKGQETRDNRNMREKKIYIFFAFVLAYAITPYTTSNRRNLSWAAKIESFPIYLDFFFECLLLCGRPQNRLSFWLMKRVVSIMDIHLNFSVTLCSFCINLGHAIIPPSFIITYFIRIKCALLLI